MDIFGDVYGAFEIAADEGAESLTEEGIPQDWADAIAEVAVKNITPPEVHISGYVDIETFVPDGVDVIIAALRAAEEHDNEEEEIKVAPRSRRPAVDGARSLRAFGGGAEIGRASCRERV